MYPLSYRYLSAHARAHAYTPPPGAVYIGIVYVGFDDVKFN